MKVIKWQGPGYYLVGGVGAFKTSWEIWGGPKCIFLPSLEAAESLGLFLPAWERDGTDGAVLWRARDIEIVNSLSAFWESDGGATAEERGIKTLAEVCAAAGVGLEEVLRLGCRVTSPAGYSLKYHHEEKGRPFLWYGFTYPEDAPEEMLADMRRSWERCGEAAAAYWDESEGELMGFVP